MHLLGADLVANKLDAAVLHGLDSGDIKVCQPQVLDGPPLLLICKPLGGGQVTSLAVVLPVKLHKVQRWGANALEGLLDGLHAGQSALEPQQELPGNTDQPEWLLRCDACSRNVHHHSEWVTPLHDQKTQMCMHCQHTALLRGLGYCAKLEHAKHT